mmetsp:Transcript_58111/g.136243  ORF Transcript_58111/g.136243 Transcript_58111/m.136243 type:complete len:239 (+) Transcript_58111:57-773(+)
MLLGCLLAMVLACEAASPSEEILWETSRDIGNCVLSSPFITGVCAGTLDPVSFGQFQVQDIMCYMPKAATVLQGLYNRSLQEAGPGSQLAQYFRKFLDQHLAYLADEAKGWNLEQVRFNSACVAYTDWLDLVARTEPLPQAVIAFTAGHALWDWMMQRMKSCIHEGNAYDKYIKAGGTVRPDWTSDFTDIDALVRGALSSQRSRSIETFRTALTHELNFFNSVIPHFHPKCSSAALWT